MKVYKSTMKSDLSTLKITQNSTSVINKDKLLILLESPSSSSHSKISLSVNQKQAPKLIHIIIKRQYFINNSPKTYPDVETHDAKPEEGGQDTVDAQHGCNGSLAWVQTDIDR